MSKKIITKQKIMNTSELLFIPKTPEERIRQAVSALQSGKGVLLVDDENRENEGDLIFPAEKISVTDMALMIRHCSGIVCLCIDEERANRLQLPLMVSHNTSRYHTAFTISIEARDGVTTGVSAADRVRTIQAAIAPDAAPESLNRPGHIFPLIARPGSVWERDGHTEGSVELMKMAGLAPYAVLCELTNDDGTMARLPEIKAFGQQYEFPVITIQDIKEYSPNRPVIR